MSTATFRIWRGDGQGGRLQDYATEVTEGMVVLDAVHQIQAASANDLAVRWNCKAGKCGSCSAEVNGSPRLMCMTRLNQLDLSQPVTIEPMRAFPPIRDLVTVNGREERHPEGAYYLEWRENGRRVRLSVGKDPADASARRQRKESELNALNNGVAVVPEKGDNDHRSVAAAVAEYLEETTLTKKPKTVAAYTTALTYFTESCPKLFLDEIERKDLLKFCAFLRDEKGQAPRSCWNKFANVMSFLKANGMRMQWNTRADFVIQHPYVIGAATFQDALREVLTPYGLSATVWQGNSVVEIFTRNGEASQ
jgi:ferredoxin